MSKVLRAANTGFGVMVVGLGCALAQSLLVVLASAACSDRKPGVGAECGDGGACAPGSLCVDGACASLCGSPTDCPTAAFRCTDGVCVAVPNAECERSSDCTGAEYSCVEGVCTCAPSDCANCAESECGDGLDGDCDGAVDCADTDCDTVCACPPDHAHSGSCGSADVCGHLFGEATDCDCDGMPACDCALPWGGGLTNGDDAVAYAVASPGCGNACNEETRVCTDGVLSGTFGQPSCTARACADCASPWGGPPIAHDGTATAYASPSVACTSSCSPEPRTCTDGTLSGTLVYESCVVRGCDCTTPWGVAVADGQSVTAWAAASVSCGTNCTSQSRTCNNGTLSGSYTNASCDAPGGYGTSCSGWGQCCSAVCAYGYCYNDCWPGGYERANVNWCCSDTYEGETPPGYVCP